MHKEKRIFGFWLLSSLFILSTTAYAEPETSVEALLTHYENGDMTAIKALDFQARKLNPHALSTLGFIYEHGINTPKDIIKSLDYYQQACDLGGNYGCGNAWYFYQYGIGIDKNSEKAAQFVQKINKDNIPLEIANDLSVTLYDAKAKAETDSEIRSQLIEYILNYLSASDEKTQSLFIRMGFSKQDTLHLAKLWAQDGDPTLNFQVGHLYNFRFSSLDEKNKDIEALKWFRRAAESGEPSSQNIIAMLYEKGDWGVKQDPEKAIQWYNKAVESGDRDAPMNLAKIYYEGVLTEVNYTKALSLLEEAQNNNKSQAEKYLSELYYNGQSVKTDCTKAANYYENTYLGFDDTLTRSKYLKLCKSDQKMRDDVKNNLPKLVMNRISIFSGSRDDPRKCELYFGIVSDKTIPVENLRVGLKITTKVDSSDELFVQKQMVAFKPFGFNSLNKSENGGTGKEYEGSELVPIYDDRGCEFYNSQTEIESATALVNGEPIDLLEKGLLTFKNKK